MARDTLAERRLVSPYMPHLMSVRDIDIVPLRAMTVNLELTPLQKAQLPQMLQAEAPLDEIVIFIQRAQCIGRCSIEDACEFVYNQVIRWGRADLLQWLYCSNSQQFRSVWGITKEKCLAASARCILGVSNIDHDQKTHMQAGRSFDMTYTWMADMVSIRSDWRTCLCKWMP